VEESIGRNWHINLKICENLFVSKSVRLEREDSYKLYISKNKIKLKVKISGGGSWKGFISQILLIRINREEN